MRKVSFGSFPLTEIRAEDRKCLDRYLIKTFADNISISDAIRNLSTTKNLLYITPDALMKAWLNNKENFTQDDSVRGSDRTSNTLYEQALKRAFYILKEFYAKIHNAPFYKEFIYYPIYVEKTDRVDIGGNAMKDRQYTEVQLNYSFVILSNDLTKNLKVDEIRYDENASLNFLFLFVEFFSGPEMGASIHNFDQSDYEFLVKLYQFIEESGKDPMKMVLDLYKLLGLIKEASEDSSKRHSGAFMQKMDKTISNFNVGALKKYKGIIKHQLFPMIAKNTTGGSGQPQRKEVYQRAFIDLMNSIFKSEGLSGLYDGVEPDADIAQRFKYVYNTNKYREILNLAKELIAYNKLGCKDIISFDQMEIDFKVEHGEYTVDTQSQIISQQYQTFFKTYVDSISDYLYGAIKSIIAGLDIPNKISNQMKPEKDTNQTAIDALEAELATRLKEVNDHAANERSLHAQANVAAGIGDAATQAKLIKQANDEMKLAMDANRRAQQIEQELDQRKVLRDLFNAIPKDIKDLIDSRINNREDDIYKKMRDSVISAIANDLTFVYDDGKRFFTNEMVTKGFMEFLTDPTYNIIDPDGKGFKNIANAAHTFDAEIDGNPNPKYYAAQIVKSLDDTFSIMVTDTIDAMTSSLLPSLVSAYTNMVNTTTSTIDNSNSVGLKANQTKVDYVQKILNDVIAKITSGGYSLPTSLKIDLEEKVYRNRFINHVLRKFAKLFKTRHVEKVIQFDKEASQLHPLIKKLINKNNGAGKECQFFKAFILNLDTAMQLYNIKFITDTKKFIYGLTNQPPRKLSNPMHKIQEVIEKYLGLKDNPVWLISKTEVFLSMPDDLSLTNTSLLSKIPKSELMQVCKIKPSDYWNEQTMGKITRIGNKKIAQLYKDIDEIQQQIDKLEASKIDKDKKAKKEIDKRISALNKKIDRKENEIAKIKQEEPGNELPNAFLFDNPNKAENENLLTPEEMEELNRKKEAMREKLAELNPYDDDEINKMEANIDKFEKSHPFDFEEDKNPAIDNQNEMRKREMDMDTQKAFEEFLKQREEYHNKDNKF